MQLRFMSYGRLSKLWSFSESPTFSADLSRRLKKNQNFDSLSYERVTISLKSLLKLSVQSKLMNSDS